MRIFRCGRLTLYPRRTWQRFLAQHGGAFAKRLPDCDLVVVGSGAAAWPEGKLLAAIAAADDAGLAVVGERAALRRLGVLPPLAEEARPYALDELARRASLPLETLRLLMLFEIIEGADGHFGFRAMKAARAAAALLDKVTLSDLVEACDSVRRAFNIAEPLSEMHLTSDQGRIVLSAGGRIADLDGQLRLELQLPRTDIEALLAQADDARQAGQDERAERELRRALTAAPKDADALFELGSLLCERGDFPEGIALLRKATRHHAGFADAWYNLGHALERQGLIAEARAAYVRAVRADADYADPLFNLGMLALEEGSYREAVERLQAYLSLDARSEWADKARKGLALARLSIVQAAAG